MRADGLLPISGSYFLYPGDLQDGTRVYVVFINGIKTGRSNIATWKMEFVLRLRIQCQDIWRHEW